MLSSLVVGLLVAQQPSLPALSLARAGSGTSWLPEAASQHQHPPDAARWGVTLHGTAFLEYFGTFGIRADDQPGSVNRLMVQALRSFPRNGALLRLRAMVSAEPFTVTGRGYPQLLQIAHSYRGKTVTDRAHPDQWVMELAALYERPLTRRIALSVYAAPVGEPALGPVAYQHRASAAHDPTRPLGHHAQDDAHASFGVVTIGVFTHRLRLEGSAFNGREPDGPETVLGYRGARLDSYAGRVTVNPSPYWSVSGSYGYLAASEGVHAHDARHRATITALYLHPASPGGGPPWSLALAYGANFPVGRAAAQTTLLLEGDVTWGRYAAFTRVEYVQRTADELALVGSVSPRLDISAMSVGSTFRLGSVAGLVTAAGARGTIHILPGELEPFYGSRWPLGIAAYLRLST